MNNIAQRTTRQKLKDFLTFPFRALTLFEHDRFGLSSLLTERFDYVAREVRGYCLDIGCGKYNKFIANYLNGSGIGIDVFPYEGLDKEHIITDMTRLPFPDKSFDSITLIATINHIPHSKRDTELKEAYRCLKDGGNIIVTMGNPVAEILVHKLLFLRTKLCKNYMDMDSQRGMQEKEEYYLTDREIIGRLSRAGFQHISKKYFATQWWLNHLFIGWKV